MKVNDYLIMQFRQLQQRKFFGKLIIEMRNGALTLIRIEETQTPPKDLE